MSTKVDNAEPIDPHIKSKMDDWGELFDCKAVLPASAGGTAPRDLDYLDPSFSYSSSVKNVLGLDSRSKKRILSLWFSQAVNGKSFLHPVTDEQVWYYSVHDSEAVKLSLELTTCFLMLLPALYQPYCSAKDGNANVMSDPPLVHRIDDHVLTSLLLIGVVVQFVDIYLYFRSSTLDDLWSWRNLSAFDNHRFWMVARILTCVFIFIDALVYFADNRNPLFMRALLPVLFVSRRENLQHLFEGTYFAIRKSWGIYRAVIMTIVIWSFTGFCLFNKLAPPTSEYLLVASSFTTFWSSLATCFKCYLSRPSVLFNLKTYFHLNQGSALFFVTLTLVADIFGSSLIIATGTRHFRDFSLLCFKFKLRNRRQGLLAIFDILEDLQQDGGGDGDGAPSGSGRPATTSAQQLSCDTWVAFCSSIRGKHFIASRDALTLYMLEAPLLEPISQLQFFRLCGALASRPKFKKEKSSFVNLAALDVARSSVGSIVINGDNTVHNPVTALSCQTEEIIASSTRMEKAAVADKDPEMSVLDIRKGVYTAYMQLRRFTKNAIKFSLTEAQRRWMVESSDFLAHFGTKIEFGGSVFGSLLLFLGVKTRLKFKPFALLGLAMHGLLIYEMVAISSHEPPFSSVVMCWFLLLFFSFENLVHYLAGSEESQVTFQDTVVNALVFFAMCCMGVDSQGRIQNQTALTLFIVFQSLRSLKLFAVLKGAKALQSIAAILFRASLLIGFAIYFFAIFGHSFFCSAFDVSKAGRATDDAEGWMRFSEFLNFDSFLLSCYTLMQVVVISNWSIVMDASQEVFPTRGFVFFYFFKALMSLAVMPLMISLIIQTFITQLGIVEPPSIRQKLKVYRVSSSHQVTSSMVAMWSPNGREVVQSPAVDINRADLAELNRHVVAKLEQVAIKKRLIDEAVKGNAALLKRLRGDDYLSEIAASVDDIPAADFNLQAAKQASAQRGLASSLGWLDTSIQLQDLRILLEMQDWASLLTDVTLRKIGTHERHVYAIIEKKYLTLERCHHADLAFLWFRDSIHARHIDLPKNRFSLALYSIHRSRWFLNLCNLLVVLQIISTLFASSPCPRGPDHFSPQDYLVQRVFAVLNLLIALFYGSETATNLYLGGQGGNWTKVRLSCCLFVTIDTLVFLSSSRSPQHRFLFSAAIFPLFWITRSNTFREVVMGLYSSLRKSAIVYNLLLAFLIMWSLLGFYLFHRYSTPLEHFKTFQSTVLTVLHCFTAAPYALDALQPLFPVSPAVVIYFLIITLSMEIVTVSLIVATSDMQFRLFAANNLKRRLSLRRDALLAIWALFARDERLSAEDWQFLCRGMKGEFSVDARSASLFFIFVTNNRGDGATQLEFFRLMALIHSRAVAAIAPASEEQQRRESARHKPSEFELSKIYARGRPGPQRVQRTIHIGINPKRATLLSPGFLESGYFAVFRSLCQSLLFTDVFVVGRWRWRALDVLSIAAHVLLVPQIVFIASFPSTAVLAWVRLGWFLEFVFWAEMVVRVAALGELTFLRRESHVARAIINVVSLCLQLQLGYPFPADDGTTLRLMVLLQCLRLFLLFWFEQGASEISKIFKVAARCLFLLFSVIFFFTIYAQNSFCNFIQPDLVLSQMYVDTARGRELANDDSSAWVPFQDLLNFDTFLQSMFTLFQIAVLGSWSMIMDAAAKTDSVKAFGFFYPYRLAIILAVLPLLNGLVIRSYVLLMDQKDTSTSRDGESQGGKDQSGDRGAAGEDDDDDDGGDLDDMVVNSDEATLSNRRISLHSRRGSRILEAQCKAQGSTKGGSKGGTKGGKDAPKGVAQRVWTDLKKAVFPSSAASADEGLRAETTRIDRNSFLSFWATGSGASGGESLLHNYEAIHLSHENVNAELGRLDEVMKRINESPVETPTS